MYTNSRITSVMDGVSNKYVLLVLVYVLVLPWSSNGVITMNDTKRLHTKLMDGYNKDVRPVWNQETPVYLNISFSLLTLLGLDEVSGTLTFVGLFQLDWVDESMVWDPALFGGLTDISVSQGNVWLPELVLLSAANEIQFVGKTENDFYKITYFANGHAQFGPSERIESSCRVNVNKYPFDIQKCEVYFNAIGYSRTQLRLITSDDTFYMEHYQGNAVWKIVKTTVEADDLLLTFKFELKRNSAFIVVNILLPLSLLGFLNVLVFLLVPESGERISYCITVLLAISVFMTITSDTLPKSSQPVPLISYKLMIDVIISMLIAMVTILNLRLHYKDENKPVPICMETMYRALCCRSHKRGKQYNTDHDDKYSADRDYRDYRSSNSIPPSVVRVNKRRHDLPDYEMYNGRDTPKLRKDYKTHTAKTVTWKHIAIMIDVFAFVFFAIAVISSFVVFVILTRD